MKYVFKVVFSLILFAYSGNFFSQTVNGVALKDIDAKYIRIVGTEKAMSSKIKIDIEFGQQNKAWSNKDTRIKNEDGSDLIFNSMVDALNYFDKFGYKFETAYAINAGSNSVYHYLMIKE